MRLQKNLTNFKAKKGSEIGQNPAKATLIFTKKTLRKRHFAKLCANDEDGSQSDKTTSWPHPARRAATKQSDAKCEGTFLKHALLTLDFRICVYLFHRGPSYTKNQQRLKRVFFPSYELCLHLACRCFRCM